MLPPVGYFCFWGLLLVSLVCAVTVVCSVASGFCLAACGCLLFCCDFGGFVVDLWLIALFNCLLIVIFGFSFVLTCNSRFLLFVIYY